VTQLYCFAAILAGDYVRNGREIEKTDISTMTLCLAMLC